MPKDMTNITAKELLDQYGGYFNFKKEASLASVENKSAKEYLNQIKSFYSIVDKPLSELKIQFIV